MAAVTDDMTLGDAAELLATDGWPCACSGPLPGSRLCCCQRTFADARNLRRGAHIAAKQLAELSARREDCRS